MNHRIVVIGTSLGGLHALRSILQALPAQFPMAVAIVQHRDRNSGDQLSTFLQDYSRMDVVEVCDKDRIIPGRVCIAPADYHLLVEDGWFSLSTEAPVFYSRPSIDVLFESAASVYGNQTIGVLLTGANKDGAGGLAEIKKRGGFTIAQDPATAECGVMPESAIVLGAADQILPLESIGEYLVGISGHQDTRSRLKGDHLYGSGTETKNSDC